MNRYKALFFGTPEISVPLLQAFRQLPFIDLRGVITNPDRPVGRSKKLQPTPVSSAAATFGVPIFKFDKLNRANIAELFREPIDVVLVVAYGAIIPSYALPLPRHGWLNIHYSLLPRYRGAAPVQTAILRGDAETGVTLMQINAGLDTGPIISQERLTVDERETTTSLFTKLEPVAVSLLNNALAPYLNGSLQPRPQDESQAIATRIIEKEDGQIDWHKPATEIDRLIRAYTPWPSAFTFWKGKRLKVLRTMPRTDSIEPGQVAMVGEKLYIGCGQGSLKVQQLQLEGKQPQTASDFIRGHAQFVENRLPS